MPSLYATLLGPAWAGLAPSIQRLHGGGGAARGVFRVRRGATLLARVLGTLMRMPGASEAAEVVLAVASVVAPGPRDETGTERWSRVIGGIRVVTVQWISRGLLVEAFGLVQCLFRLRAEGGGIVFDQVGARVGGRRIAVPLPRFLAPVVTGAALPREGGVHVRVAIGAPILGTVIGYEGLVTLDEALDEAAAGPPVVHLGADAEGVA